MMQAADLRDGDHLSDPAWQDRPRVRTILVERQMRSSALVVIDIGEHYAAQMALVEDDDVIQTLAGIEPITRSTYAFCHGDRGAVITSVIPIASTRLQK